MATLPVWLEIPPLPGDTIIVKVKKIMPEKRKIYMNKAGLWLNQD